MTREEVMALWLEIACACGLSGGMSWSIEDGDLVVTNGGRTLKCPVDLATGHARYFNQRVFCELAERFMYPKAADLLNEARARR